MLENPWIEYQNSLMNVIKQSELAGKSELEKAVGPLAGITPEQERILREHFKNTVESNKELQNKAIRFDAGKTDWSLVPWDSVEEIVKVLEFGKVKYAAWNWSSNGGFKYMRVFNSTMRHLLAWARGEDKDPESGLSHLSHAACNLLFIIYFVKHKDKYSSNDDRNVWEKLLELNKPF